MKKFSLIKNNNSKKLYIGVSIIFCAVILIVGGTYAFFTQSDSKKMEDLLTSDIRDTLKYTDNKEYMRQGLIPAKESIAKQAYALTEENKCIDINGYSACSVYQFNIKNIANVSQELIIDLAPTVNNFGNLYFMVYEIDEDGNSVGDPVPNKLDTLTEEMIQNSNIPSYNLAKEVILNPNSDKTYEVVFFVNDTGTDQTSEDAGKTFGGTIKISSVTTGKYMVESFGEDCWKTELLSDGTYKLTEFTGINNEDVTANPETGEVIFGENYGKIDDICLPYFNDSDNDTYYSVYIPSEIGDEKISTLGSNLFGAMVMDQEENINFRYNYSKINDIDIEDGIIKIEDACFEVEQCPEKEELTSTFAYLGFDLTTFTPYENYKLNISFPDSLEYIGNKVFVGTMINNDVTIPANVSYIGEEVFSVVTGVNFVESDNEKLKMEIGKYAFNNSSISNLILPKKIYKIGDFAFSSNNITTLTIPNSVTSIGDSAFSSNNITTLTIPNSVTSIGDSAFSSNNITTLTIPNSVKYLTGFDNNNITTLTIPNSVTSIGDSAFSSNNITTLTIPNSVTSIGDSAFSSNNITTLTIPNSVTSIGDSAFSSNNITTLTIPNSVTSIGDFAFSSNNITTLTIPNSVTSIGNRAFSSNKNLTELKFEEGSKLTSIGDWAFRDCNLTYTDSKNPLVIPSSVTSIGSDAFDSYSHGTDDNPRNRNLKFIRFSGALLEGNPTDWYNSDNTTLNPPIEE